MSAVNRDSIVTLRKIDRQSLRSILQLNVAEDQQQMVASNAVSIAEAYFEPGAWFRGIYADETPVGFIMTYENREKNFYYLWRLMIDNRFQRCGFGRRAVELLIARIKRQPGARQLLVSVVPDEGSAIPFYEKLGFVDTGRVEDGERVFTLSLEAADAR